MSALGSEERRPEIIIVRRGGDDEDEGHHGGVWKIALADFMTALMCFFLVMWLINAANEQTRAALASYFNPVKLVDRNTNRKGLEEIGQGPQNTVEESPEAERSTDAPAGAHDKTSGPSTFQNSTDLSDTRKYSDENFFSNPYAVLAEIAADIGREQNISQKGEGGQQEAGPSSGASGGEAYRDPFAPDFWSQQVAVPRIGIQGDPDDALGEPAGAEGEATDREPFPAFEESEAAAAEETQPPAEAPATAEPPEAATATEIADEAPSERAEERPPAPAEPDEAPRTADAHEAVAQEMHELLAEALEGEGLAASVQVSAGRDGVLISVTDELREGMFAVGSAVPERPLVLAMEKIGRTLAERQGHVRVHGHTDARPFTSGDYDNWRLSTARAHAAQYMLVRGGLDETRIVEVGGFADRRLKLPEAPLADANRRIEILLEVPQ